MELVRRKRITIGGILIIIIVTSLVTFLGLTKNKSTEPIEVYAIYIDGDKIGQVKSENELEAYINKQEEKIKEKYNIDDVHTPKGVDIKKIYTYNTKTDTAQSIYEKMIKKKKFAIKGIVVTVKNEEKENKTTKKIYVTNKKIFDESLKNIIKAFVGTEQYSKFLENTQEEIQDTGSLIENIDLQEKVTYKKDYIAVDNQIFTNSDELTKYLLYGSIEEQQKYTVKEGDTIEDVARENKLNVQEFLIANPTFTSANNLLYSGQEVIVGLINPVISVVVDVHSVEDVEKEYTTEIKYDENQNVGYENVEREGEKGLDKVVKKYQYINGQLVDAVNVSSTEIKPAVSKIVVKGEKVIPNVADTSYWGWPTEYPYTITSYFEYRWGSFHNAIDIYVGYNSSIYAANNGTVYQIGTGCAPGAINCNNQRGNFIIINHNTGNIYTQYMHLNQILVQPGQTVSRGQKIATMGNTGFVVPTPSSYSPYSGTHLDFSVYIGVPFKGGTPINPLRLY